MPEFVERAVRFWRRRGKFGKGAIITLAVLVALAFIGALIPAEDDQTAAPTSEQTTTTETTTTTTTTTTSDTGPPRDPTMNKRTREYIAAVQTCQITVGLVLVMISKGEADLFEIADSTTTARDTCDTIRSRLTLMDTDHFDDQALVAWGGVDRMKSGMNALLTYIDNPGPSKLVEARNKIQQGDREAALGIRQINARRVVYGLKKVKLFGS